jgi:hypothetical protein
LLRQSAVVKTHITAASAIVHKAAHGD